MLVLSGMPRRIRFQLPPNPLIRLFMGLFVLLEGALLYMHYEASDDGKSTIVFGATVVGGAFAFYAYLRDIKDKRGERADRLIERWNSTDPELEKRKDVLRSVMTGALDPRQFMRVRGSQRTINMPEDTKTRAKIIGLLNFCEEAALAVRMGSVDEEKVRRSLEMVLVSCWTAYKPWIEGERELDPQPVGEEIYCELQVVVERWQRRER